ncbi:hypothetical protein [Streptomyces sp. NPDC052036]|uniref:hypothetical protein n=1 Tax=Streptomyces sp. NPDC052036 TaxID=3155171 RepID=UPI003446277B
MSVEGRSPSFGSGVTDPSGTASEGIHEDVLSGDGPVWGESPERTVKVEEAPSVAEPHSAVVEGGGSAAVTGPGEVRSGVSAAEHAASDGGALRSLPGRTVKVEEAPSVAEPFTEGSVHQQLPQGRRSVEDWLNQVVDDQGPDSGPQQILTDVRAAGAAPRSAVVQGGGQRVSADGQSPVGGDVPEAGRGAVDDQGPDSGPQQILTDVRTGGAAPRSGSAVVQGGGQRVSADGQSLVGGDVPEAGRATLESSGSVPRASPSRAVPVGRESGGLPETGPAPGGAAVEGGVPGGRPSDVRVEPVPAPEPGTADSSGVRQPQSSPPVDGSGPAVSGVVRQPVEGVGGPRRTGEAAPVPGHDGQSHGDTPLSDQEAPRDTHGHAGTLPPSHIDGEELPEAVRSYVFHKDDPGRAIEWADARSEVIGSAEGRFGREEEKFWQQRKADDALNAAYEDYLRENMHGVPPDRPVTGVADWARRAGVPQELAEPVARAYEQARRESGPGSGRTLQHTEGEESQAFAGEEPGDEAKVPDRQLLIDRLGGVDGLDRELIVRLAGAGGLDPKHAPAVLADAVLREQARAGHAGPDWHQNVKDRFNRRWQADLEQKQSGALPGSEFARRFGELAGGLREEFELSAAADSARTTAEEAYDDLVGRPAGMSFEVEARGRARFGEDAASEVYKAAERFRTEDGRIDPEAWDDLHRAAQAGIDELRQGLRTRAELVVIEFHTLDEAAWGTGVSAGRLEELREEFAREFGQVTRALPDGREVRRLASGEWLAHSHEIVPAVDELVGRWHDRLAGKAVEDDLRARTRRLVEDSRAGWRAVSHRAREDFDSVKDAEVVEQYHADVLAQAEFTARFARGGGPGDAGYAGALGDAHHAMRGQLEAWFDYHAGLKAVLRQADERIAVSFGRGGLPRTVTDDIHQEITRGYREWVGWPERGTFTHSELGARERRFHQEVFEPAMRSVPDRVAFEQAAEEALRDTAGRFNDMSSEVSDLFGGRAVRRFTVSEETFEDIRDGVRRDAATRFNGIYGPPEERDMRSYLETEKAERDAFGEELARKWEEFEQGSPYAVRMRLASAAEAVRMREASAAEAVAGRQRLAALFEEMLGKPRVLEELSAAAGVDPDTLTSPGGRAAYERDMAALRKEFSESWDNARRQDHEDPGNVQAVRQELVQQTRERMEALREQARAQEAAYAQWRANQSWTLRSGGLDVSRDPFRAPSADEHGTQGQLQVQEQVFAEPVRRTSEAGPRIAQAPRTRSAAQDRLADDAVAGLDRMRQAAAGRDKAYREFEARLDQHPRLRSAEETEQVGAIREWYADQHAAGGQSRSDVPVDQRLAERLRQADAEVAARQAARDLFERQVVSSHAAGYQPRDFRLSPQYTRLVDDFHQALADERFETPAAVVDSFRKQSSVERDPVTGELYEYAVVEETDADRPSAAPLRPDPWESTEPVSWDFFGEDGRWLGRAYLAEAEYELRASALRRLPLIERYNQWSVNAQGEWTAVQRRMPASDAWLVGHGDVAADKPRLRDFADEVARAGGTAFTVLACSDEAALRATEPVLQSIVDTTRLTIHQPEGRIAVVPGTGGRPDEVHLSADEQGGSTRFRTFVPGAGVPVAAEGGDEEVAAPSDVEPQYPANEFWNTPSRPAVDDQQGGGWRRGHCYWAGRRYGGAGGEVGNVGGSGGRGLRRGALEHRGPRCF